MRELLHKEIEDANNFRVILHIGFVNSLGMDAKE